MFPVGYVWVVSPKEIGWLFLPTAPHLPNKGNMAGELPWPLFPHAQLKSKEKQGQKNPWKPSHTSRACAPLLWAQFTQLLALSFEHTEHSAAPRRCLFSITPRMALLPLLNTTSCKNILEEWGLGQGGTEDGIHNSNADSHQCWSEQDQIVHIWFGATAFLAKTTCQQCCWWYRITAWSHRHSTKPCLPLCNQEEHVFKPSESQVNFMCASFAVPPDLQALSNNKTQRLPENS